MNTKYSIWLPIYISDNPGGNLKECEGDCDRNSQCEGKLQCYQRGTFTKNLPPGCKGQQFETGHDFCFDPDKAGVNSMPPGTFSIFPANWSWCHLSGIALALYIDDRGQIRRKLRVVVWISINCGRKLQVIWVTMMYIIPMEELPVIGPIHVIPGITAPNTIPTRTVMMWLGMETTFLCSNTRPCGWWRWRCAPWLPLSWHSWFAEELRQNGKWCTGKFRLLIRIPRGCRCKIYELISVLHHRFAPKFSIIRCVVFVCDIPVCVCSILCAGYVLLQFRCTVSMCLCIAIFRWQSDAASMITRTLILSERHRDCLYYLSLLQSLPLILPATKWMECSVLCVWGCIPRRYVHVLPSCYSLSF